MVTILQLYAKRLEKIDKRYTEGKMTKKVLEKELKTLAKELNRLARSR